MQKVRIVPQYIYFLFFRLTYVYLMVKLHFPWLLGLPQSNWTNIYIYNCILYYSHAYFYCIVKKKKQFFYQNVLLCITDGIY